MTQRDERLRLKDILRAVDTIYDVRKLLIKYPNDELLPSVAYNATFYSLVIIGEAVNKLDRGYKAKQKHIDWRTLVELRNRLTHQYYEIEADYIDILIKDYLGVFAEQIEELLDF